MAYAQAVDPNSVLTIVGQAMLEELAGNYDKSTCQPVTAHWLKIYPPGQFTALYVKFSAQTCSAKLPSNLGTPLSVDAVKAGKGKAGGGL